MKNALIALTLTTAGLLATPAFAGDATAEDRYHEAYVLEVIDGKVADAAKSYLALIEDKTAPGFVRHEARFRFAVCTALLGRSDEARLQLGELLRDAEASADLKSRAQEYLEALRNVGVGSELDKKLQTLVFELGRAPLSGDLPAVYRDFEVIGDPARPLLRSLLDHSDSTLRAHAFALLCRMSEPGMVEHWTPEIGLGRGFAADALRAYLTRYEGSQAALEKRLMALDDEGFVKAFGSAYWMSFSVDVLRAAASRGAPATVAVYQLGVRRTLPGTAELAVEWLTGDDDALSLETAKWIVEGHGNAGPAIDLPQQHLPLLARRLAELDRTFPRTPPERPGNRPNNTQEFAATSLYELARAADASIVLDACEIVAGAEAPDERDMNRHVLWNFLFDALADALDDRSAQEIDGARYAQVLKRLIERQAEYLRVHPERSQGLGIPWGNCVRHLSVALDRLPADAAQAWTTWLLEGPGAGREPRLLAAWPIATEAQRKVVVDRIVALPSPARTLAVQYQMDRASGTSIDEPLARVVTAALPSVIAGPADFSSGVVYRLPECFSALAPSDAIRALTAAFEAVEDLASGRNQKVVAALLGEMHSRTDVLYMTDVLAPNLDRVWASLAQAPRLRERALLVLLQWIGADAERKVDLGSARDTIASFLLAHAEETQKATGGGMLRYPDLFPLVRVIPASGPGQVRTARAIDDPGVRQAVDAFLADPASLNEATIAFLGAVTPPESMHDALVRLIREVPSDRLELILRYAPKQVRDPAWFDALAETVGRLTAAPDSDLRALARATTDLAAERPSVELFGAVRRLLTSGIGGRVVAGIQIAKSLGREDLLPDLVTLLDSLDDGLRNQAREAIDAIVELRRLKQEAKRRADGAPTLTEDK